jgi:hypothetical protein
MSVQRQIVQVNEYDLKDSPSAYLAAIQAVARRTEAEGHAGVLAYRFYANRTENTAGATIVYDDSDAWVAHHDIAYTWDEMPVLQSTVSLKRLTLLGPLSASLQQWLSKAGISYVHYDTFAAGFVRDSVD